MTDLDAVWRYTNRHYSKENKWAVRSVTRTRSRWRVQRSPSLEGKGSQGSARAIAWAVIDRLHYSTTVSNSGEGDRLKDKKFRAHGEQ